MNLKQILVENFRCIEYEVLTCDNLAALVGANGSGKSAFLKAIDLFYDTSPRLSPEDFYNGDTKREIRLTVAYVDLDDAEMNRFGKYVQNGELSVVRVLSLTEGKPTDKYHGSTLQSPDFVPIRRAGSATAMKEIYVKLTDKDQYKVLRKWKNQADALAALAEWEQANQAACQHELDEGQFFGFKQVAQGYLGASTRYLYIPAVRDAADDAAEGRGSVITQLMDLVVRSIVQNRADFKDFKENADRQYGEIFSPSNLKELESLAGDLTSTLRHYVPDSGVELQWLSLSGLSIPMPQATLKLVEDGYKTEVERTGHGLQRAFIMSLLQHLAVAQARAEASAAPKSDPTTPIDANAKKIKTPNLILGIEEPELYQHPGRQRHLADLLMKLSRGQIPGVAERTQIIYSTHSPLFISLDRFNEVRLVRKTEGKAGFPRRSQITTRTLDSVAERLWQAEGMPNPKFTGETLQPRLAALFERVSEAFFASVAVLVEGDSDRAAIVGVGLANGCDLEAEGVSVIACGGKSNVCTAAAIFISFGVPIYCVWDSDEHKGETAGSCEQCKRPLDKKGNPTENHRLLRLLGAQEEDWPHRVDARYACFRTDRETEFNQEIGAADFIRLLEAQMELFGIHKRENALKNPRVISAMLMAAKKENKISPSLEMIVRNAAALKR